MKNVEIKPETITTYREGRKLIIEVDTKSGKPIIVVSTEGNQEITVGLNAAPSLLWQGRRGKMIYYIQKQTPDHKVKTISKSFSTGYANGFAEALQADDPLNDYRVISRPQLIKEYGHSAVSRAENDLITF